MDMRGKMKSTAVSSINESYYEKHISLLIHLIQLKNPSETRNDLVRLHN